PGEAQGVFAIESHIDEIARALGRDPADFRLQNLIRDGEPTPWDETFVDVRAVETLEAVIEASGFHAPKPAYVGRGIAIGERGTGAGQANSRVTLNPDGTAVIGTPILDQGTGTYTTLVQVVGEELGIPRDRISIDV